ncbi:hypothetical protein JL107_06510 [Nakamurella flavida]|uniref:Uncharacterized protein n=1 Tax=Nakamurella flavida TaxID=363630 RepID=A0A938YEB1_9ACTN|nr:hypothetical protein [Nakamurella flavida]MBM9476090.1 hypothetical protein [Nakamurella flavida]MDP9777165.1 hypothetical protein [Nakamurella flavida]
MTGPTPGPLAAEAGLLLDVLAERLAALQPTARPAVPDGPGATPDPSTPAGTAPDATPAAGPACTTGCPFCQVLAVVRGERPETAARLVDGALVVVRGLRSLLDHSPADHGSSDHGGSPAATDPGRPAEPGRHPTDTRQGAGSSAPPPGRTTRPDGTDSSADQAASTGTGTAPQARVEWIDIR